MGDQRTRRIQCFLIDRLSTQVQSVDELLEVVAVARRASRYETQLAKSIPELQKKLGESAVTFYNNMVEARLPGEIMSALSAYVVSQDISGMLPSAVTGLPARVGAVLDSAGATVAYETEMAVLFFE